MEIKTSLEIRKEVFDISNKELTNDNKKWVAVDDIKQFLEEVNKWKQVPYIPVPQANMINRILKEFNSQSNENKKEE